ncbi:hypothetical protein Tco_1328187 [Tanacetum coccineum]
MTKLTQKKVKFVWGDKQEAAFQLLKQKVVKCTQSCTNPKERKISFIAIQRASKEGLGHVLCKDKMCDYFASRQLKIHEKNYTPYLRTWSTRRQCLRYKGLQYTNVDIMDFEARLTRIYMREVHRVQVFDFGGLPNLMAEGLSARMLMEHKDAQGQSVFGEAVTDLDTTGALQFQLGGVRRRMSWREFILALGLYTAEEMQTVGFGAYWAESARQIPDKGDLRDYWIGISSAGDFLGTVSHPAKAESQGMINRHNQNTKRQNREN